MSFHHKACAMGLNVSVQSTNPICIMTPQSPPAGPSSWGTIFVTAISPGFKSVDLSGQASPGITRIWLTHVST